jgi:hypothetical protein
VTERKPRGPRTGGVAEGVAAAVRRRQRERGPRVLLYDAASHGHQVAPSAPGYDELLGIAGRMVELLDARETRGRRGAGDS